MSSRRCRVLTNTSTSDEDTETKRKTDNIGKSHNLLYIGLYRETYKVRKKSEIYCCSKKNSCEIYTDCGLSTPVHQGEN